MIELRALTKSFRTVHGRHYVFRDLSLTFPDRTNIGLIGPNGAGKSTLMRIIGGIDVPDHGAVVTDRRISFPVGLSGGFQGTLSGRDNAKFVCRLYGVNPKDVREKVNFVENFAELGKYFDMPIKTYSSGMRSRLIFGLSMAFDFDYYLMDEVGAVGDAGFKEKSRELLEAKIGQANVICVSHNMNIIREQCEVVVLLRSGEAIYFADIEEGISAYHGEAYVRPASVGGKKGRLKRVTPDSITPQLIKRARRIIRVARRARREGQIERADLVETDTLGETSTAKRALDETPATPKPRSQRKPGARSRRRGAKLADDVMKPETPSADSGEESPTSRAARAAAGKRRRLSSGAGIAERSDTAKLTNGETADEDRTAEALGAERAGTGRRRRKAARRAQSGAPTSADGSPDRKSPPARAAGRRRAGAALPACSPEPTA